MDPVCAVGKWNKILCVVAELRSKVWLMEKTFTVKTDEERELLQCSCTDARIETGESENASECVILVRNNGEVFVGWGVMGFDELGIAGVVQPGKRGRGGIMAGEEIRGRKSADDGEGVGEGLSVVESGCKGFAARVFRVGDCSIVEGVVW